LAVAGQHKRPKERPEQRPDQRQGKSSADHWVCVGAFGGAHGVSGDVKLTSFTDEPAGIFTYGALFVEPEYTALTLNKKHGVKAGFVVAVDGIDSREAAILLKGKKLFIRRDQLPEPEPDEYYVRDLGGLEAIDADGKKIGVVEGVHDFGAGYVLDLLLDEPRKGFGRSAMLPFANAYVGRVDIAAGTVVVMLDHWLGDPAAGKSRRG
jgi:16S rRNA processing protein RimM